MSGKIEKFLRKLSKKQLAYLMPYVIKVEQNDLGQLDVKPMKGHNGLYRVRVGRYRIVFRRIGTGKTKTLFIGKRDDQTYRNF